MQTLAMWRSLTWNVSPTEVKTIEDLAYSYEQQADNNQSTEDTALTNMRGTKLFPLSFKTILHAGAGIDVRQEIEKWRAELTKSGIFYLNGIPLGPEVQLRKIAVSGVRLNNKGAMLYAVVSLSFMEYEEDGTSVPETSSSAQDVGPSATEKANLMPENKDVANAPIVAPSTGTYVTPAGSETPAQIEEISGSKAKVNGEWTDISNLSMI